MLDGAVKDKACAHFAPAFEVELFFEAVEGDGLPTPHKAAPNNYLEFERDGEEHEDEG